MEYLKRQWSYEQLSFSLRFVSGITLLIAQLIGIIGNLLVLILITKILKRRKSMPNILILFLCIVDLLSLPLTYSQAVLSHLAGRYIGGAIACNYHATAIVFFKYMSIILICMISLDRFLAMTYPFCYKEHIAYEISRKHKIATTFSLIAIFIAILSILPLIGVGENVLQFPNSYCLFNMDYNETRSMVLLSIHVALISALTVLIMLLNIGVCIQVQLLIKAIRPSLQMSKREVKRQATVQQPNNSSYYLQKKLTPKQEKKLLKISIFTSAVFAICWLPFLIRMCLAANGMSFSQHLDFISARLASFQSVITPWLYPLLRKQYSDGFWHLLRLLINKISFNLIKKPHTNLDDIIEARSTRRETLQLYSQRTRTEIIRNDDITTNDEMQLNNIKSDDHTNEDAKETKKDKTLTFIDEENENIEGGCTNNSG